MTTLNLQVSQGSDDCLRQLVDSSFSLTSPWSQAGDNASDAYDYRTGLRFQNVTIGQGDTIDAATIQFYVTYKFGAIPTTYIEGEDTDNAAAFTTLANYDGRARTSAVTWTPGTWVDFAWQTSSEIKTIIQTIVDRGGWASGQALVTFWRDAPGWGGTQARLVGYSYNGSTAEAPKLDIDYSEGFVEGAAVLSGVGLLAAAGSLTLPASAIITGIGSMVAAGTKGEIQLGAADLSGAGSLSAAGEMTRGGKAVITGVGSVTVAGERGVEAAAVLAGVGTLTAVGEKGLLGAAALNGVGNLSAAGVAVRGATASLSGAGTLTAVGRRTVPGAAVFAGVGNVVVRGEIGGTLEGQADLAGIGSMTVAAVATYIGEASLSGVGSLDAVAERIVPGAAVLAGIGSLTVSGERGVEAAASLSGVGTVTVVGQHILWGAAALAGTGSLSASAIATLVGAASLDGVGSMSVIGETGNILYTPYGKSLRLVVPADYPTGRQFYLEIVFAGAPEGGTIHGRLFNLTLATLVAGSEISSTFVEGERVRSSALTLPSGDNEYRIEFGGVSGKLYPYPATVDVLVGSG